MRTLIVIDMQNDFIDGPLGTKEAKAIVSKVNQKITEYRDRQDEIIFVRDTHFDAYPEIQTPATYCIYGTLGWELSDKLSTSDNDEILNKTRLGHPYWDLRKDVIENTIIPRKFEEIEIVGLRTDVCVISNALILRALFPRIPITVDAECCAGTTSKCHRDSLNIMKNCNITVIGKNEKTRLERESKNE